MITLGNPFRLEKALTANAKNQGQRQSQSPNRPLKSPVKTKEDALHTEDDQDSDKSISDNNLN